MDYKDFIGQDFWKFFNELPLFDKKKELTDVSDGNATLLLYNLANGEKFKVVCKCKEFPIMKYCFYDGSYTDFGRIISIEKLS